MPFWLICSLFCFDVETTEQMQRSIHREKGGQRKRHTRIQLNLQMCKALEFCQSMPPRFSGSPIVLVGHAFCLARNVFVWHPSPVYVSTQSKNERQLVLSDVTLLPDAFLRKNIRTGLLQTEKSEATQRTLTGTPLFCVFFRKPNGKRNWQKMMLWCRAKSVFLLILAPRNQRCTWRKQYTCSYADVTGSYNTRSQTISIQIPTGTQEHSILQTAQWNIQHGYSCRELWCRRIWTGLGSQVYAFRPFINLGIYIASHWLGVAPASSQPTMPRFVCKHNQIDTYLYQQKSSRNTRFSSEQNCVKIWNEWFAWKDAVILSRCKCESTLTVKHWGEKKTRLDCKNGKSGNTPTMVLVQAEQLSDQTSGGRN